jgi:outer membrane protein assembly factor BamB
VIEGGITLIDNNSIYATSSGDGVYKFNEEGTNLYKLNVNGDIKSSTTITHNHMVYIASTDYNLYSFNSNGISNSGWPVSLGAEATASVALDNDNNVYIGTSNGIFQAISPAGTVLWGYNVGAPVNASSVISSSNILYVINENGRIVSFDLNTINPSQVEYEQMYELGESVMSSPALDDEGYMYVTTLEGNLIKLDVDTSSISQMWSYSVGNSIYSSPVIGSDYTIYFGSDGGKAYAINSNGTLKWEKDLEYPVRSTAALAEFGTDNDRLYIGSDGGYLNTLSLINGVFIDKYRTDSDIRCPILYNNNTVYFGTMDGEVIAIPDTVEEISLSKKTNISSQWPTFQGNNRRTGNQIDLNTSVASVPEVFILNQNSPNPWNPTTKIEYRLPSTVNVTLYVFDITGRKVKEWSISNQQAGWHKVIWDGTDMHGNIVSTGVYIYSLRAGNFVDTKKMVFMK